MSDTVTVQTSQTDPKDGSDAQTPADGGDTLLAGKFKNVEELEKSYLHLQTKLGERSSQTSDTGENQTDSKSGSGEQTLEITQEQTPDLDIDDYAQRYREQGDQLTTKDYEELEAKGYKKEVVDTYISGQVALANQAKAQAFEVAGGEENYGRLLQWAKANLNESEIAAYNEMVNLSPEARLMAVQGLKSRYEGSEGTEGSLLGGVSGGGVGTYGTWADVSKAMQDERYGKDSAYTAEVQQKLKNSKL